MLLHTLYFYALHEKVMPFNCLTGAGVMSKVMLEIFNDINAENSQILEINYLTGNKGNTLFQTKFSMNV